MSAIVPEIINRQHDDFEPQDLAFHLLIRERLLKMHGEYSQLLDTVDPAEIAKVAKAQEGKKLIALVLGLPEKLVKERREKRSKDEQ